MGRAVPRLVALAVAASAARPVEDVAVDLNRTTPASPLLRGYHFSPLNHELALVYAQLIFDESFEQTPLNGCSLDGRDESESAALCAHASLQVARFC